MKKIIHQITVAVALLTATSALAADFEKGVKAYERGKYKAALRQFRALAEEGHAGALFYLGLMYADGEGVPEDDRQAVSWYRKAAGQGDAQAQNNLGFMYDSGEGVPEDDIQAYAWFNLAAAQGVEEAKEARDDTRQHMTSSQIAEAQKLSREIAARIERNQSGADSSSFADNPDLVLNPEPEGNGS